MRGGRGLKILTDLTPVFLFICLIEEHEIYLTCRSNRLGFLESRNPILLCSIPYKNCLLGEKVTAFSCVCYSTHTRVAELRFQKGETGF